MNIRLSLKLALFAFLSALACVVANVFIGLEEIAVVADLLWFFSYICIVVWLCKHIAKAKKAGKNLTVSFFTFAIALYCGIYSAFMGDTLFALMGELLFYIAAIACLISVVILIGRWIFGKADKDQPETIEQIPEAAGAWICACGTHNTGKFCTECGSTKPEVTVVSEEPAAPENNE